MARGERPVRSRYCFCAILRLLARCSPVSPVLDSLPPSCRRCVLGWSGIREAIMLRTLFLVAVVLGVPAAHAQTAAPDPENGRFTFNQVEDEFLRLDTRTGQVSDRKSTRLNSSHVKISYAVFCLKKKK